MLIHILNSWVVVTACLGLSFVLFARIKYGNNNRISELERQLVDLNKHMERAKKDQLHERLSRVEASTGAKLF